MSGPLHCLAHAELLPHRRALFQLAYRMTGSASDADDVVQEAFARVLGAPPPDLSRSLRPYLVRVAMNVARDLLRARVRRGYRGPWLPEPVATEELVGELRAPDAHYGERESVSLAFLVALEALRPSQRAIVVLRDVLDYSVEETAAALGLSAANVKTSHHRARAALAAYDAARAPAPDARVADTLRALCVHLATGNVHALEALLAADVIATHDGNGEFLAAQRVVVGRARVLKLHLRITRLARGRLALCALNGTLALVSDMPGGGGRVPQRSAVFVTLGPDGRIARLDAVVASAKLARLDFGALRPFGLREGLAFVVAALRRPGGRAPLLALLTGPRDLRRARPRAERAREAAREECL